MALRAVEHAAGPIPEAGGLATHREHTRCALSVSIRGSCHAEEGRSQVSGRGKGRQCVAKAYIHF